MSRPTRPRAAFRVAAALWLAAVAAGCVTVAPADTPLPTRTTPSPSPAPTPFPPSTPTPSEASSPTPSSTDPGTPPPSAAPSGPAGTLDPELVAQIDSVIAQVPEIRELEPTRDVPYEFISREQFRADLLELAFEEVPREVLAAEERLLKRLGLLPDDASLEQLLVDLYGGQVAAFYRPDTGRFYLVETGRDFGPSDKIIVAHEYTHALQDQHFDLEGTRITDLSEGDAALAQLAAIEGDATLTMLQWMQLNLSPEEQLQAFFESLEQLNDPTLSSMPWILRRQLEFPYSEGQAFVQAVHGRGGFEAVNGLIREPPPSTEQVLHPEKYLSAEEPVDVELSDLPPGLGDGWQNVYEQTFGELLMQVFAAGGQAPDVPLPGLPTQWPNAASVDGWGGDRLAMYEHPDGRWAIVWLTAWDSGSDASDFASRAGELQPTLGGPAEVNFTTEIPPGLTVDVLVASDQATLDLLTAQ